MHGFTCGVSDLILKPEANAERKILIESAHKKAVEHLGTHLGLKESPIEPSVILNNRPIYEPNQKGQLAFEVRDLN